MKPSSGLCPTKLIFVGILQETELPILLHNNLFTLLLIN